MHNVEVIYEMLDLSPEEVYKKIFLMRGITIKNKLSIIASCLNDQKELDLHGKDLKNRCKAIKKAAQSLATLVAKTRIKDEQIHLL